MGGRTHAWVGAWLALICLAGCGEEGIHVPPPIPEIPADIEFGEDGAILLPMGALLGEPCGGVEVCRPGLICDPGEGICIAPGDKDLDSLCIISAECLPGLVCSPVGLCALEGEGEQGSPCQTYEDCGANLFCNYISLAGICSETGDSDITEPCEDTGDCMSGLVCDLSVARCVQPVNILESYALTRICEKDEGPPRVFFEIPDTSQLGSACLHGVPIGCNCVTGAQGYSCPEEDGSLGECTCGAPCADDGTYEFYRLPFPNDIRMSEGRLDLGGHPRNCSNLTGFDPAAALIDAIEDDVSAFSTTAPIFFRFSRAIDLNTVVLASDTEEAPPTDTVVLVDIDPDSPAYGKRMELAWAARTGKGSGGRYICDNWLTIRPLWVRPLRPGNLYAAMALKGLQDSEGNAMISDGDFTKMLSAQQPVDPIKKQAWSVYAPLRSFALDTSVPLPIEATRILAAAVFTTGDAGEPTRAIRDAMGTTPSPSASQWTLCEEGVVSPCDDGLTGADHVRGCFASSETHHELHARITVPLFQAGSAPHLHASDGGQLAFNSAGKPVVQGSASVCVSLTIPKTNLAPADGWPAVIYGPPLGGTFRSSVVDGIAASMSALQEGGVLASAAVLTMEQVGHGPRRCGASNVCPPDTPGPEWLAFNLQNPRGTRGMALQATADFYQLERLVLDLALGASESPTGESIGLDPTKLWFMGHSQGASTGVLAFSQSLVTRGGVLGGLGGGVTKSLLDRTSPAPLGDALGVLYGDLQGDGASDVGEVHPVMGLLQHYFLATDPLGIADQLFFRVPEGNLSKHVLLQWGLGDTFAPDSTIQSLGGAMRASLAFPYEEKFPGVGVEQTPIVGNWGGVTGVIADYIPDEYDGHLVFFLHPGARHQANHFIGTGVCSAYASAEFCAQCAGQVSDHCICCHPAAQQSIPSVVSIP